MPTGPDDAGPESGFLFDAMLADLDERWTVDWVTLGFGCYEPFFTSTPKAENDAVTKKQVRR